MFQYSAVVNRVIDGDTIELDVDLGFDAWLHSLPFRVLGINTREKSMAGGPEARAYVEQLLPRGTTVTLTSVKPDKFGGRWNAKLTLKDGRDLTTTMIAAGFAAAWNGRGAKPLPPWPIP